MLNLVFIIFGLFLQITDIDGLIVNIYHKYSIILNMSKLMIMDPFP